MSFLNDIVSVGSKLYNSVSSSPLSSSVLKAASIGLLLNQVNKSVNKQNSLPDTARSNQPDRKIREQLSPNSSYSIPVVYGSAYVKGTITDAVLTEDKQSMWYCITICEKTGTLLSNNQDSVISFNEIWWNNQKLVFEGNGSTVAYGVDANGNINNNISGLIEVYCFNNGSNSRTVPISYSDSRVLGASDLIPTWGGNHDMSNLVFCVVKLTYNKEKNVTSLGDMEFKITNSLSMPGDVLYDYLTNNRYGAGIDPADIKSQ
jgi:hypothetical protein